MRSLVTLLTLFLAFTAGAAQEDVGVVAFASSGAPSAQQPFLRGLAQLHNFEYPSAAKLFRKAQEIPDANKRNAAYKALQVPLWNRNGYVVFAFYNTVDASSAKVHGIVANISSGYSNLGAFDFKDHWFG